MRMLLLAPVLTLVVACKVQEEPDPDPWSQPDPVVLEAETDRKVLLSGNPGPNDFKVNFPDPFIGFETRGARVAISQSYGGPSYRVVDVSRSKDGDTTILRGRESAIPGDSEPFILTIRRVSCTDQFTRERTDHIAWLGTDSDRRQVSSCAARAK